MSYRTTIDGVQWVFADLKSLLAKASPARSGDSLAGIAAASAIERVAAQIALADLPLKTFLNDCLVPYEQDEVSRLIVDSHDTAAFAPISHLTVGEFREWLLDVDTTTSRLSAIAAGVTPEMVAAVSKLMRLQDLIAVAAKCSVVTAFRNTIGLEGRLSTRLQPNHPTDDSRGIAASLLDGLTFGAGDAVFGVNPATESRAGLREDCDLAGRSARTPRRTHADLLPWPCDDGDPGDRTGRAGRSRLPVDRGLREGQPRIWRQPISVGRSSGRGAVAWTWVRRPKRHVFRDRTRQRALRGRALRRRPANDGGSRLRRRAKVSPLLVNTVVGFIGPEYLYDGKEITRAGLEDHFCGKLLGLPMGCDVCYTNHAEADQDDMDGLLTLLCAAGVTFVIAVPGADDVMLNYQSLSFHDILYARQTLGRRCAPEFEDWLLSQGIVGPGGRPIDMQNSGVIAPTLALIASLDRP